MSPSRFVIQGVARAARIVPGRKALDVAAGSGRHVAVLASAGFAVFAVDRSLDKLREAAACLRESGGRPRAWCADLTAYPLPVSCFDLVLVSRYLQRDLFPALKASLVPGGVIVYETFTVRQVRHGRGPTSPDHLLEPGELLSRFGDFEVLDAEEIAEPDALARIVARRPRG